MGAPGPQTRRLRRELETVRALIGIYCRAHHAGQGALCEECEALWRYANERVDRCPFGMEKPTCAACTVHCYKASRREQIREVMRYAGPRMTWRHPLLTIFHFIDQRRPAPVLRRKES